VLAAAGTSQPIVDRLNAEINKIVESPQMKEFFLREGAEPSPMKPAEFEAFIAAEIERWKKVAKASNITAE
jgi:tripartite-type tricarboxylate transporter receptor subunit TctC